MDEGTGRDHEAGPRACLRAMAEDPALSDEGNFAGRAEAMDLLEPILFEAEAGAGRDPGPESALAGLAREARALKARWEALDASVFGRLRAELRAAPDASAAFRRMLETHAPILPAGADGPGYDALDLFVNGLLHPDPVPEETRPLEADMVAYQKTPARIALDLIARSGLSPRDLFLDVGSGLGQVPILAHLLAGARALGIEREPAYVDYARACAAGLGLTGVEFLACDARAADYAQATALFLYTPFRGAMLEEVLERIRRQSRPGARLFTYGPCTAIAARRDWLTPLWPLPPDGAAAFRIL